MGLILIFTTDHLLPAIIIICINRELTSGSAQFAAMRMGQVIQCLLLVFNVYVLYPTVVGPFFTGQLVVFAAEASESYYRTRS